MRADAARRRAAIVHAARALIAERGAEIALDAVAEAAGVGIATLYRNFESRAALLDEVAAAILADVRFAAEQARPELAGVRGAAAAAAWEAFLRGLVDLHLGALSAGLAEHAAGTLSDPVREAQDEALRAVDELLRTAVAAGAVRADLSALELVVAVGTLTRPQPAEVLRAAPRLPEQLLTILVTGTAPSGRA
ncbi:TetR family transcriptional regulator [Nocardioides sp. zg-536]|uniref:TetR family transcriptional regulator n=1 Tax=Nocardioides faecalis TaxID=2803858 RepID=A0A938Y5Q2_9ACTN|nr:TetR family transcriptional regulator [Nocardioides faecalis]MBM9459712.1 TetR family transcriptional regulator [Nocardioides faecalis]QVI58231.1 TetR family transcriptional regulator [Nocardioides faecalis]